MPLRKRRWKIKPNNLRRAGGHVHEHFPPEQVETEVEHFLKFHEEHAGSDRVPKTEEA